MFNTRRFIAIFMMCALAALTASVVGNGSASAKSKKSASKHKIATSKWQMQRCGLHSKEVWLTFDDYGSSYQVNSILKVLRDRNVRAIFFPTGSFMRNNGKSLMRKAERQGHVVGNHTSSHANLPSLSNAGIRAQMRGGPRGNGAPSLMRPPGGSGVQYNYSRRMVNVLKGMNYQVCGWTVDTNDWRGRSGSAKCATVRNQIRSRGVILMHFAWTYQRSTLNCMISAIRRKGLKLPKRVENDKVVRGSQFAGR